VTNKDDHNVSQFVSIRLYDYVGNKAF